MRVPTAFAVLAAALLSASASAETPNTSGLFDAGQHDRRQQVWLDGVFIHSQGVGVGVRYSLPILKDGLLASVNDSLEVDVGGDIAFGGLLQRYGMWMAALEPRWTFHLSDALDFYAKVGLGARFTIGPISGSLPLYGVAAVGASYRLTDKFSVRLEGGYPGLKIGAGMAF